MPTYVTLLNWTDQGIRNVKESPARLDAAKAAFEGSGAKIKEFFLLMGQYDMVIISEAPSDEVVAKLALTVGSLGSARTVSMRAFAEDEYRKIIADLP